MVDLIPSSRHGNEILKRTGAFREGHFVYPKASIHPTTFDAAGLSLFDTRECWPSD